jgi:hypothetical protein
VLVLTLFVAALATARLARLVADDTITAWFRAWVVRRNGATGFFTRLVHCAPWCMSMWFAVLMPVALFWHNQWVLAALLIPAGSMAAAILLNMADRE